MHDQWEHEHDADEGRDRRRRATQDQPETERHEGHECDEHAGHDDRPQGAGRPRLAEGAPPLERTAWPRKNDAKLRSTQNTTVTAAPTPILAASSMGRLGVAAKRGADGAAGVLAGDKQRPEHAAGQAGDDQADQRVLGRVEADVVAGAVVQVRRWPRAPSPAGRRRP